MKNLLRLAAAAALLLTSGPALAQSRAATRSGLTSAGVLLGFEDFGGDTGLALRGDVLLLPTRLAPKASVGLVLSLGYSRFSESAYHSWDGTDWDWTTNILKFTPAARFAFDVAPRFGLYADAGLGLHYASMSWEWHDRFGPLSADDSVSDVGLHMRFAGGAQFQISPGFDLGAEIGLNPYFGDFEDNSLTVMMSAMFRM